MTGAQLIFNERDEQIYKHAHTVQSDVQHNKTGQLVDAAIYLLSGKAEMYPQDWGSSTFEKLNSKTHKQKLVIAGALIAAEIDRLEAIEETNNS